VRDMGRYSSNDNRSMQLNPNNERYWSSRGYDDDSDDETRSFDRAALELEWALRYEKSKELIDSISIGMSGKRIIFMESKSGHSYSQHPVGEYAVEFLFERVLKEKLDKKDLTVRFESFKRFVEDSLDFDSLRSDQEKLRARIELLKKDKRYRYYKDESIRDEILLLDRIKRNHSFVYLNSILEEKHYISDDVKRNYIYFRNFYVSDSYIIFGIDPRKQGRSMRDGAMNYYWAYSPESCDLYPSPSIVYEDFEEALGV